MFLVCDVTWLHNQRVMWLGRWGVLKRWANEVCWTIFWVSWDEMRNFLGGWGCRDHLFTRSIFPILLCFFWKLHTNVFVPDRMINDKVRHGGGKVNKCRFASDILFEWLVTRRGVRISLLRLSDLFRCCRPEVFWNEVVPKRVKRCFRVFSCDITNNLRIAILWNIFEQHCWTAAYI